MNVTYRATADCNPAQATPPDAKASQLAVSAAKVSLLAWANATDEKQRLRSQGLGSVATRCGAAVLTGIAIVHTVGKAKERSVLSVGSSLVALVGIDVAMRVVGQIAPRIVGCLMDHRLIIGSRVGSHTPRVSASEDLSGGPI